MTAPAATEPRRDARLDLRLTPDNRALIQRAATLTGASLTDFVVSAAVRAARADLLQERVISLDPEAWDEFLEILDMPDTPAMAELRMTKTRWDVPSQ